MENKNKNGFKKAALTGIILIIPSAIYLAAMLLKYGLHIGFLYDPVESIYSSRVVEVIVFFSPLIALLINLIYLLKLSMKTEEGSLKFNFEVRLRALNIGVSIVCLCLIAVMWGYVVTENLGHYYRGQM